MDEALTTYETLILEKDWITHDPKSVVFANLLKKAESTFKRFENRSSKSEPIKGGGQENPTKKMNTYPESYGHPDWKLVASRDGETTTMKKGNHTYH